MVLVMPPIATTVTTTFSYIGFPHGVGHAPIVTSGTTTFSYLGLPHGVRQAPYCNICDNHILVRLDVGAPKVGRIPF